MNFNKFQNLRALSVEDTQKLGNGDDHNLVIHETTFPLKLTTL